MHIQKPSTTWWSRFMNLSLPEPSSTLKHWHHLPGLSGLQHAGQGLSPQSRSKGLQSCSKRQNLAMKAGERAAQPNLHLPYPCPVKYHQERNPILEPPGVYGFTVALHRGQKPRGAEVTCRSIAGQFKNPSVSAQLHPFVMSGILIAYCLRYAEHEQLSSIQGEQYVFTDNLWLLIRHLPETLSAVTLTQSNYSEGQLHPSAGGAKCQVLVQDFAHDMTTKGCIASPLM